MLTLPIRDFSEHSWAFPANTGFAQKVTLCPVFFVQDGILHKKSALGATQFPLDYR